VTEEPKYAKFDPPLLDLSVDGDAEAEEAGQHAFQEDPGEDDVEGHGFSGFNLPE
jgi:hypothetical protein